MTKEKKTVLKLSKIGDLTKEKSQRTERCSFRVDPFLSGTNYIGILFACTVKRYDFADTISAQIKIPLNIGLIFTGFTIFHFWYDNKTYLHTNRAKRKILVVLVEKKYDVLPV